MTIDLDLPNWPDWSDWPAALLAHPAHLAYLAQLADFSQKFAIYQGKMEGLWNRKVDLVLGLVLVILVKNLL